MPMIRQEIRTLDDMDALNKAVQPLNKTLDRGGGYKEHIWNKMGISRPYTEKLGVEIVEMKEEPKPKGNRIERIPNENKKKKKKKK